MQAKKNLKIDLYAETRDNTQKQGINKAETRDKPEKQGIKADVSSKTRDKILQIEGISEKTRDKLQILVEYVTEHQVVKNHEIAELLSVGDDRARVLLMLLVDNAVLTAKGDKKERTYSLH